MSVRPFILVGLLMLLWVSSAAHPSRAMAQDEPSAGEGDRPSLGLADYDVSDTGWRGLSRLIEIITAQDIELRYTEQLDFSTLSSRDALVIIYPEQPLDKESIARFVVDGGRVFLADDFGASDDLLERLSLSRLRVSAGHLPHDTYVADRPALPIFRPRGRHPLLEGVEEVVANHPSVLFNVGGPVIAYSEGGGLVYDMSLGKGRAVVMADASILINQMLPVADNERLVTNTLAYLCAEQSPCRVTLLVRTWQESGSYRIEDEEESVSSSLARSAEHINEVLRDLMDDLPTQDLLYYLSILLVAGLAAYLATVFPLRSARAYSRYVADTMESVPTPQTEFDWNLARFGQARGDVNFILPMAILKEVFEELFLKELGLWPSRSGARPDIEELGEVFARRFLEKMPPGKQKKLKAEVVEVLATFAQIPTRHRVFLDSDDFFGEREMLSTYTRAQRILKIMGLEEEYERRTGHLA